MRVLLLNPNTSPAITDRLAAAARKVAALGTTLVPLAAPRGILAAFGGPGLLGARELFDMPVVGTGTEL